MKMASKFNLRLSFKPQRVAQVNRQHHVDILTSFSEEDFMS